MEIMTAAGPAHVVVERPRRRPRLLVVLTHGAGGTPDTPDVLAARDAARPLGAVTALVTQPYRVRGGRAPGSAARQDAAWAEIVAALNEEKLPLVQGGRSNGARVACRTARQVGAIGVIALAFPLHPPGQPGKSRDGELRAAGTSVLVLNGDRDPFGIPEPDDTIHLKVVVLPGETHALSKNPSAVGEAVAGWLGTLPGLDRRPAVAPRLTWPGSGRWGLMAVALRTVRSDHRPVWQQLAGVLEDDDTVAEQAPALLGVTRYGVRRFAVRC